VHTLFKIPVAFFLVAACMGLFMRYVLIAPVPGVNFTYVMHGHSHVMFLGWIFNVLYLAFVTQFTTDHGEFRILFWILQVCVAGMLVSFPVQGYGLFSILFTTLHTLAAFVFIVLFLRAVKNQYSLAITLARAALMYFALASIGPFCVGYLKASGQEQSNLYRFAIYFYLHFQYNGFFTLGVLSLLFKTIEHKLSPAQLHRAGTAVWALIISCLPAYFLSTLWAEPGVFFNITGFISALAQALALLLLVKPFRLFIDAAPRAHTRLLLRFSGMALFVKSILQILSAHPAMALLAAEFRSILIAYLHLVLLGFISIFMMGWLYMQDSAAANNRKSAVLVLSGFIGSEALLILTPWSEARLHIDTTVLHKSIFIFSCLLVAGTAGLLFRPNRARISQT